MRQGKVKAVIVGTHRVAANGDVANKIGTFGVATEQFELVDEQGVGAEAALEDERKELSAKLGENIQVGRFELFEI